MRVVRADTFRQRTRGLGGRRSMPADEALLIPRCRSVHTYTMRFALDLVWLDGDGHVIRIDHAVPPRRLRTCLSAAAVLECAAGTAERFLDESHPVTGWNSSTPPG
jgi:uncharacterized membrane protein (UPF0127 family)